MLVKKNIIRTLLLVSFLQIGNASLLASEAQAAESDSLTSEATTMAHTKYIYVTKIYKEAHTAPMIIYYNDGVYSGVLSYDHMEYNRNLHWHVTYSGYVISGAEILPTNVNSDF